MAPGPPDLLPGTLDLLILRTLQKDALHGWAISERIQHVSEDVLQVNQGSLYPALHPTEAGAMISQIVHVTDPVSYLSSLLVIVVACLFAAWIPAASRAARVDPMNTLRQE